MKKSFFYILFLLLATSSFGQSNEEYWDRWNTNYPEVDMISVLKQERAYADSIENKPKMIQYYVGPANKYRFDAEYLGETRDVSKEVFSSMKRVFKLRLGDPKQLDGLVEKEVLFKVGQEKIWMPIQPKVLEYLEEEVEKGNIITLYCILFTEHSAKGELYNTFFISEFSQYKDDDFFIEENRFNGQKE